MVRNKSLSRRLLMVVLDDEIRYNEFTFVYCRGDPPD